MHIFTYKKLLTIILLNACLLTLCNGQETDSSAVLNSGVKVSGIITDASTQKPIEGISASIPGFSSALTDSTGKFIIDVPAKTSTLIINGPGYQTKEVPVKGRNDIMIKLHEEKFNSVFRSAYFSSAQKPLSQVVNSVASVRTQNSFQTSAETPENYMQGKVPGLNLIRRSGTPGIGTFMSLRGFNSLHATNRPLMVVDGMIYDMNDYGGSLINNYFSNPLENIDIKDIQNITVVKDASSTYGSKGANGVIYITTGHSSDLATKIDFAASTGINYAPENLPVMDVSDYRIYLTDVLKSAGYTDEYIHTQPYMTDDPGVSGYYKYHGNTNWQDRVFRNSSNQNYYLKVTGGDNISKLALSAGYLKSNGIVEKTSLDRSNLRFNGEFNISPRLIGNTDLSFAYNEHQLVDEGQANRTNPVYLSLVKAPFLQVNEVSDEGEVSPNLADADIFNVSNPLQLLSKMVATNKNYRFYGSVNFKFKINEFLNASTLFGITYDKIQENIFIPSAGVVSDTIDNAVVERKMGAQVQRTFSTYNDTRLLYQRSFNNTHGISARLGLRFINNRSEEDSGFGFNSATDDLQTIGTGVSSLRQIGGELGQWIWLNYYAGIDYSLRDKYFLSLNVATDGSSRFGKEAKDGFKLSGNSFGVFPSIGAAWLLSAENFMANTNIVDLLKLRINYGLTGNDDIGNYSTRRFYTSQNLLGIQGIVLSNIANPQLQWETVKKLNVGLDIALFNERVSLNIDAFQNKTENMLTYKDAGNISGYPSQVLTNSGGMKNTGVELALNARVLDRLVKLDFGLGLATYKNEVTALPADITTSYASATILTAVGHPVAMFYGYKMEGVYSTDAEGNAYSLRLDNDALIPFSGGDVRFADLNSDNIIDGNDMTIIGDPNPDFTGMFSTHVGWKKFTLDAGFTFSYGNDIYNYTRAQLESMKGFANQTEAVINRWRTNGQVTNMPRVAWGDPMGNSRFSDRWIEDGSYMRLRTISASYELPFKTDRLKYIVVYVTGNNLLTFTKYLGYDPEFSASNHVLYQGIDIGLIPQSKSVLMGIRIGL